jgi:hypothetical protein
MVDELYALADANPDATWDDPCFDDFRERYAASVRERYQKAVIRVDRKGIYNSLPDAQRFRPDGMADAVCRMIHDQRPFCWLPQTSWNWRRSVKDYYLTVRSTL